MTWALFRKFQPYSAWNEKGPRIYNSSVPSRYSSLQVMLPVETSRLALASGKVLGGAAGAVGIGRGARAGGGIVVAQFGSGLQRNSIRRAGAGADAVRPVLPSTREAEVQQVPAFVFIDGQAGPAGLNAVLAGAEEVAAVAVIGTEDDTTTRRRGRRSQVLPNQMPLTKFWSNSMAWE